MKLLGKIILIFSLATLLLQLRFEEPEWQGNYDSTLLSKDEVLDIAEQVFVIPLKQGIEAEGEKPNGYYLRLFNGDPESEFFERFSNRRLPKVKRGLPGKYPDQRSNATIDILRFEQIDMHKLRVIYAIKFRRNHRSNIRAIFEKKDGYWRNADHLK